MALKLIGRHWNLLCYLLFFMPLLGDNMKSGRDSPGPMLDLLMILECELFSKPDLAPCIVRIFVFLRDFGFDWDDLFFREVRRSSSLKNAVSFSDQFLSRS